MLTFLIMAGGSGERFWPLSRKEKPKHLLKIFSDKSLIRLTYERVLPLADRNRIFIATNEIQVKALKEELPEIDDSRIIIEPLFKDTAPAIAYGTLVISKYFDNPTVCALASDSLVSNPEEFRDTIRIAEKECEKDNIVTIGIKPTYPETGYGYIEAGKWQLKTPTKVISFKEKPHYPLAKLYYMSKRFLWNSGMFIFKQSTIMTAFKKHSKNHFEITNKISGMFSRNEGVRTAKLVRTAFDEYEKKSIDFAVMEEADNIVVIPSEFGWNDVGSYLAFEQLFEKDVQGNVVKDIKCISVDSKNNIIVSDGNYQQVDLLGVKDMIICVVKDHILICRKNRNQEIKRLISLVKQDCEA